MTATKFSYPRQGRCKVCGERSGLDVCYECVDRGKTVSVLTPSIKDLLIRVQDYLEGKADSDNGVPNEEMKIFTEIEEILNPQ